MDPGPTGPEKISCAQECVIHAHGLRRKCLHYVYTYVALTLHRNPNKSKADVDHIKSVLQEIVANGADMKQTDKSELSPWLKEMEEAYLDARLQPLGPGQDTASGQSAASG